jgi:hypothetical protein
VKHVVIVHVAYPSDGSTHNLLDVEFGLGGDFTADTDDVAFDERLTGDAAAAILHEASVKHSVGNRV